MKKVNLTIALTDLQGKEIKNNKGENLLLNKEVATLLVMKEAKENIRQRYELAQKLNNAHQRIPQKWRGDGAMCSAGAAGDSERKRERVITN